MNWQRGIRNFIRSYFYFVFNCTNIGEDYKDKDSTRGSMFLIMSRWHWLRETFGDNGTWFQKSPSRTTPQLRCPFLRRVRPGRTPRKTWFTGQERDGTLHPGRDVLLRTSQGNTVPDPPIVDYLISVRNVVERVRSRIVIMSTVKIRQLD